MATDLPCHALVAAPGFRQVFLHMHSVGNLPALRSAAACSAPSSRHSTSAVTPPPSTGGCASKAPRHVKHLGGRFRELVSGVGQRRSRRLTTDCV